MYQKHALILDLDGTLLHVEPVKDPIIVPGRTRPAYLAGTVVSVLTRLCEHFDLVLATGRSWAGMRLIVEGLAERGITLAGVVLEDGALLGKPGACLALEPERCWEGLRQRLSQVSDSDWPDFEWQGDFEACLVARASTADAAKHLAPSLYAHALAYESDLRCYRDGRKVYLLGKQVNKWAALAALLRDRVALAVGVGDGLNDLCWLSQIALPCTLKGAAEEVARLVVSAGGLLSKYTGHWGIAELLLRIDDLIDQR